jgi:hypothetical protein
MATPNPVFQAAFPVGTVLTDHDLGKFERFLKREDGEDAATFANRLAVNGLAYAMTAEQTRNIPEYKQLIEAARADKVPLVVLTGVAGEPAAAPTPDAREQAKMDALAAARAATTT